MYDQYGDPYCDSGYELKYDQYGYPYCDYYQGGTAEPTYSPSPYYSESDPMVSSAPSPQSSDGS